MSTTLIEALKEKQRERQENQVQFAEFLGIGQSALSRIYNGKRGIGNKVLARVLDKYPDLVSFFVTDYVNKD